MAMERSIGRQQLGSPTPSHDRAESDTTAWFRLCHMPSDSGTDFDLKFDQSTQVTEVAILDALGENGRATFALFHEEREPCLFQRPISDLINIWHPDKIDGCVFCLHTFERSRPVSDLDLQQAEQAWRASEDDAIVAVDMDDEEHDFETSLNDVANVTLIFDYASDAPLDPAIWSKAVAEVPRGQRLNALPSMLAGLVRELAKDDEKLLHRLGATEHALVFTPRLRFGDERDLYVDFEDGRVQVETIQDLFRGKNEQSLELRMEIRFNDIGRALNSIEEAVFATMSTVPKIIRLGSMQNLAHESQHGDHLLQETTIIGIVREDGNFQLGKLFTCAANSLIVGDSAAGFQLHFDPSYRWTARYFGVQTLRELRAKVQRHCYNEDGDSDADEELLTAPTYSFRDLRRDVRSANSWKGYQSTNISVSVRYVSMLQAQDPLVTLPPTIGNFVVGIADQPANVAEMLRKDLQDQIVSNKTRDCLLDGSTWRLILWVLPQIEKSAKMYRWRDGSITQFLRGGNAPIDNRLYLEAHIVA